MDSTAGLGTKPHSCWAQLDGPVHYVDFGGAEDGPLLVFVHGLGGSWANWLALAPLLTDHARLLAVDLAGHGRTPAAGRRTDVRANQRLLDRFLSHTTQRPVLLVGNSMGGMISLMQAHAAPGSVAGLVLLDPALPRPRGVRHDPEIARMFAGMLVPRLGEAVMAHRRGRYSAEELVRQTLTRCTVDPSRVPPEVSAELAAVLRERSDMPGCDRALVSAARSVVYALAWPGPLARMIRTVAQPTLLLHGSADRLIPVQVAHHLAGQRPDWRVEIMPGIGHIPQLEDAPATASAIADWLRREGQDAAARARPGRPAPPEALPPPARVPATLAQVVIRPESTEIGHPPRGTSDGEAQAS